MNDQVTKAETEEILRLAEQCLPVAGDWVELGCYRGDTSVLLGKLLWKSCGKLVENSQKSVENHDKNVENLANPVEKHAESVENSSKSLSNHQGNAKLVSMKHLWIYDSFAGLPAKSAEDASGAGANFQQGELLVTKREVIDKLRKNGLKNVIVKKAWFEELTEQDLPAQIGFAFCDGDLYSSIKTSLKLVVPRLQNQGIIIVHDYNNPELPGSARAVDEFLRAHPEFCLQVRQTLAILTRKTAK